MLDHINIIIIIVIIIMTRFMQLLYRPDACTRVIGGLSEHKYYSASSMILFVQPHFSL